MVNKLIIDKNNISDAFANSTAFVVIAALMALVWIFVAESGDRSIQLILSLLFAHGIFNVTRQLYRSFCFAVVQKTVFLKLLLDALLAAILSGVMLYFIYQQPLDPQFKVAAIQGLGFLSFNAMSLAFIINRHKSVDEYNQDSIQVMENRVYVSTKFKLISSTIGMLLAVAICASVGYLLLPA